MTSAQSLAQLPLIKTQTNGNDERAPLTDPGYLCTFWRHLVRCLDSDTWALEHMHTSEEQAQHERTDIWGRKTASEVSGRSLMLGLQSRHNKEWLCTGATFPNLAFKTQTHVRPWNGWVASGTMHTLLAMACQQTTSHFTMQQLMRLGAQFA